MKLKKSDETMDDSKITRKYRVTIPKEIRGILDVKPGDSVHFTIFEDDCIVVSKAHPIDEAYLKLLQDTLTEWNSPEDDEAFANL